KLLVEQELSRMIREFETQLQSVGMNLSAYLEQTKKTDEELRNEWMPQAKKRLAAHLVTEQISKDETLAVPTEEIEAEMNRALQYYKNVKDAEKNMDMERLYQAVQGQLQNEKVLSWLESL